MMAIPPDQSFELLNADRVGPVIVSVPHAGRAYTPEMLALMRPPPDQLQVLEDRLIDSVAAALTSTAVLIGRVPRGWIDLNRHEAEVDPGLVDGYLASRLMLTPKVRNGLGLVPRRLAGVGDIWRRRLSRSDVEARIEQVHRPYHATLADLIDRAVSRYGVAVLLDLHSMPTLRPVTGREPARIVIGDRFGQSAARWVTEQVNATCRHHRLLAQENSPYAGGYVVERHASPARGVHAVQVELDRSLYLAPGSGELSPAGLARTQSFVAAVVEDLERTALAGTLPVAAE